MDKKPTDPALTKLLASAQDAEALSRLELYELLRASFRVTVAGLDVTDITGPPLLEPELQRARELRERLRAEEQPRVPSKRALRRKRRR